MSGTVKVYPLPHMPVVKDLVPDLTVPYAQLSSIQPWLQTVSPEPAKEWQQSHEDRAKLDGLYECILCFCCQKRRAHPTGGMANAISAPPWLLQGLSLADRQPATRTPASASTISRIAFRLYRCHTIMNCTQACPKGLNPAKAIARDQEG